MKNVIPALVVCALIGAGFSSGRAAVVAQIGEVLTAGRTGPAGTYGKYIEVQAQSDVANEPFDLVIADASTISGRLDSIYDVVTLTAQTYQQVFVIYDGTWPSSPPPTSPLIPASLNLGFAAFPGARSLIVFDHDTSLSPTSTASDLINEGGVSDVVTYQIGSAAPASFAGEPIESINYGDAIYRIPSATGYTGDFTTGPVDDNFAFADGTTLSPGRNNVAATTTVPEPISAGLWMGLSALGWTRRGDRRRSARV